EFGSPDSSRVRKPIDLCGSFGRIPSTLGLLRVFGRQGIHRIIRKVPCRAQCQCNCASQHGEQILTSQLVKFLPFGLIIAHLCRNLCHIQESKERFIPCFSTNSGKSPDRRSQVPGLQDGRLARSRYRSTYPNLDQFRFADNPTTNGSFSASSSIQEPTLRALLWQRCYRIET